MAEQIINKLHWHLNQRLKNNAMLVNNIKQINFNSKNEFFSTLSTVIAEELKRLASQPNNDHKAKKGSALSRRLAAKGKAAAVRIVFYTLFWNKF